MDFLRTDKSIVAFLKYQYASQQLVFCQQHLSRQVFKWGFRIYKVTDDRKISSNDSHCEKITKTCFGKKFSPLSFF
jgi:hypothetical protein